MHFYYLGVLQSAADSRTLWKNTVCCWVTWLRISSHVISHIEPIFRHWRDSYHCCCSTGPRESMGAIWSWAHRWCRSGGTGSRSTSGGGGNARWLGLLIGTFVTHHRVSGGLGWWQRRGSGKVGHRRQCGWDCGGDWAFLGHPAGPFREAGIRGRQSPWPLAPLPRFVKYLRWKGEGNKTRLLHSSHLPLYQNLFWIFPIFIFYFLLIF